MAHVTSARDNTNGDGLPRVPSIPLSDDRAIEASENQSIGHLVKDATTHLSTLVRAEIELAKSELAKEVRKGLTGSISFVVAGVIALSALPYLFITFALALNEVLWYWAEPWGGFLIMFVVMLLLAWLIALFGRRKMRRIKAPQRTISTLKDTAATLSHRGDTAEAGTELTDRVDTAPRRT